MLPENSFPLPTLNALGVQPDSLQDVDVPSVVATWFSSFSKAVADGRLDGILSHLTSESYWRDLLALTWDFRTFSGIENIKKLIQDRVLSSDAHLTIGGLIHTNYHALLRPFDDIAWIQFFFQFEINDVGIGSGVVRLIPVPSSSSGGLEWKAHAILTNLEDLKGFPEKIGPFRDRRTAHGKWMEARRKEAAFEGEDPTVLVVGGSQSGLEIAARLQSLGVKTLVAEREPRIGGNWRSRYDALTLHDPVWYDHMPYIPFPPNWPIFAPALKLANWLEFYADSLEINIWTSSTVTSAAFDEGTSLWKVTVVTRLEGQETTRVFNVKHVVFAIGLAGGNPFVPSIPGLDVFKGDAMHSLAFKSPKKYVGKKAVVIGSCTSAHDISGDFHEHGIDVTMYQRSSTYVISTKNVLEVVMGGLYSEDGPPTDLADRINASFNNALMGSLAVRQAAKIAELDKDLLDGLEKRGFKTNMGYRGAGFLLSAWEKAGGYYLDVGCSQLIIDGKIKVKSGTQIKRFVEDGIEFEDGSKLEADVVVFATGFGDGTAVMRSMLDEASGKRLKRIWGLNDEGELRGAWRDLGTPGLWCMMGNLALCRFHSKHIALQIKAIEEGKFGTRYAGAE